MTVGENVPTPTATPGGQHADADPTPTPGESCPATVDLGCTAGFAKGSLLAKDGMPGRERLVVRMLQGPALAQTDLGNPLDAGQGGTGTAYALCVYDDASALAVDLQVARAGDLCEGKPCWRPIGNAPNDPRGPGKGYRYRDPALASDGVLKIVYRGGDAGRSQVVVIGKGPSLPAGMPAALRGRARSRCSSAAATVSACRLTSTRSRRKTRIVQGESSASLRTSPWRYADDEP